MSTISTNKRNVPIIDLKIHYESIKDELEKVTKESLSSANYILGPNVEAFENELASYLGCNHVVSCANGTDALVLALMALEIKEGDEVITVSNSYFATSESIATVGAEPVFIDIRKDDFNIDPEKIEAAITKKTKAIICVHLYGQPCEIEKVVEIAKKHNLFVIEDNAQAIGAKYNGKCVGAFGDIGTTSFYPTKNLGACGDGGATFTNNKDLADKLKLLRAHGSPGRYVHDFVGLNSRLDDIQAAILRVKLKHLNKWIKARQDAAKYYDELLKGVSIITPKTKTNCTHVFHQYTLTVDKRDYLYEKLGEKGVRTLIYYPIPIHKQKAFSYLSNKKYDLAVTNELSEKIISLPMYPELKKEDQEYVAECIKELI